MSIYEQFAQVYDIFMEDIPYDKWCLYIREIWQKFGLEPSTVVDVACGTGSITTRLAKMGYDMIGIDISQDMLCKASEKAYNQNLDILYLSQDMVKIELYDKVDAIICICDSVNYILEEEDLLKFLKRIKSYLNTGGIFIFDINTIYKFKNILSDNTFCQTTKNLAYTHENFFDEDEMINEFYTNFFIEDEKTKLYRRFVEIHYEKGYTFEKITKLLEKAELKLLAIYDDLTFEKPTNTSERVFFVVKKT